MLRQFALNLSFGAILTFVSQFIVRQVQHSEGLVFSQFFGYAGNIIRLQFIRTQIETFKVFALESR